MRKLVMGIVSSEAGDKMLVENQISRLQVGLDTLGLHKRRPGVRISTGRFPEVASCSWVLSIANGVERCSAILWFWGFWRCSRCFSGTIRLENAVCMHGTQLDALP
jgi:hypothetical protein